MSGVITEHGAGDDRFGPLILQIHLRRGDVELAVQAVQERLEPSALFLERGAGRQVETEGEQADHFELFVRVESVEKFSGGLYFNSSKGFQIQEMFIA
jgi:hypothetical protein